jgi:prepilin-type N-terminal cleavage/methylation domain-containing protein
MSMLNLKRHRGFTLVEALVVASVLVLLASLLFPVLAQAKRNAKMSRSMTQMHQIHVALMMYVDGQAESGADGLGLPPGIGELASATRLDPNLLRTGGSDWKLPGEPAVYTWMPPRPHVPGDEGRIPLWREHLLRTRQNPVILLDETFSPTTDHFSNKLGQGLYYDGHIARKWASGSLAVYTVWE